MGSPMSDSVFAFFLGAGTPLLLWTLAALRLRRGQYTRAEYGPGSKGRVSTSCLQYPTISPADFSTLAAQDAQIHSFITLKRLPGPGTKTRGQGPGE
ncbi:hypothetical protein NDU88_000640 [Pleurodeles waltl]|uniref:Uncharacterized protein n=1 Tax=Pleurodeles waltl TaxID=8319 RepID=A0AAV7SA77_PLEWA|nr:hypothetical protein NDU88_000640 [Pleurodeles waltl]